MKNSIKVGSKVVIKNRKITLDNKKQDLVGKVKQFDKETNTYLVVLIGRGGIQNWYKSNQLKLIKD